MLAVQQSLSLEYISNTVNCSKPPQPFTLCVFFNAKTRQSVFSATTCPMSGCWKKKKWRVVVMLYAILKCGGFEQFTLSNKTLDQPSDGGPLFP